MSKQERDRLAHIYCKMKEYDNRKDEEVTLLENCLDTENDFKEYLCSKINWSYFKEFVEENEDEFRRCGLL